MESNNKDFRDWKKLSENPYLKFVNFKKTKIPYIVYKTNGIYTFYDGKYNRTNGGGYEHIERMDEKYIKVKCPLCDDKINNEYHNDISDCWDCFNNTADDLYCITNNNPKIPHPIDLRMTGKITDTAILLFFDLLKIYDHSDFENVDLLECEWLENATMGAMLYCKKGYKGKGHKYDFISRYPSRLNSTMYYPYKKGTFEKIEEIPKKIKYGIYRCVIEGKHPLFKNNPLNYYTHSDIEWARSLGLKIDLIIDDKDNFLSYPVETRFKGKDVFGDYMNELFKIKNNKKNSEAVRQVVKNLMNCLWGVLVRREIKKVYTDIGDDKIFELYKDKEILSIEPSGKDEMKLVIKLVNKNDMYVGAIPRIKPFLISQSRNYICKVVEPYFENCVHIHTDGFVLLDKNDELELGDKMGDLKYEGIVELDIKNVNDYKLEKRKNK